MDDDDYNRNNVLGTKSQGIVQSLKWSGVIYCHRYDETVGHKDKLECDGIHKKGRISSS